MTSLQNLLLRTSVSYFYHPPHSSPSSPPRGLELIQVPENTVPQFQKPKTKNQKPKTNHAYITSFTQDKNMDPHHQKHHSSLGSNLAFLSLLLACVVYLSIWSSSSSLNPLSAFQKTDECVSENPPALTFNEPQDELEVSLSMASMDNKTVIIAMINKAYAVQDVNADTTMLDLFLESFWLGDGTRELLDHLVLVAVDQTAYDRCRFLRLNCYRLETDGVDFGGEKLYMSPEFIKMMWKRTWFLLEVLKRGYSFVFTDTDVVWLRNPFTKLSKNETEDLQISTDMFFGDPWNTSQLINTGFYYIKSNNKTIALFDKWYSAKDNSTGLKEQDVLLNLIRGGIIPQLGLRVRFLDTVYFSGFCQNSRDIREVSTVHANCCRSIVAKVKDLKAVFRDWKKFKKVVLHTRRVDLNVTAETFRWTGHWGCWNSWKVQANSGKAIRS